MSTSMVKNNDGWEDVAIGYAEHWGWEIVPLHPVSNREGDDIDDSIVEQLGHRPLIEVPSEATTEARQIREWSGFPQNTLIGVRTGRTSDLVAIEVPDEAETELSEKELQQLQDVLPNSLRVLGPNREYHLFSFPKNSPDLPALTPFSKSGDGLVLHGEGSIIRVPAGASQFPGRSYSWDLTSPEQLRPFPMALLSFFGVDLDVSALRSWQTELPLGVGSASDTKKSKGKGQSSSFLDSPPEPPAKSRSTDRQSSRDGRLTFRSGHDLRERPAESRPIGLPWLARGALSVLTGPPKTAGKSTFVVNLAAHLAEGTPFLGWSLERIPVVLLSDLPPQLCRSLLHNLELGPQAQRRLHIVHPADAAHLSWRSLLGEAFSHADQKNAGLVIVDSLDQFVEVKGGTDPTENSDLAHRLTTEAPEDCAVLAVKALSMAPPLSLRRVIVELGLLGNAADLVLHMDEGPTAVHPTLRRIQMAGRFGNLPSYVLCRFARGRYRRLNLRNAGSIQLPDEDQLLSASTRKEGPDQQGGDDTSPVGRPVVEPQGSSSAE